MTLSSTDPCSLLSAPLTSGVRAEARYNRPNTEALGFSNTSKQFRIENSAKNYNSQFFKVRIMLIVPIKLISFASGVQCETGKDETNDN